MSKLLSNGDIIVSIAPFDEGSMLKAYDVREVYFNVSSKDSS